MRYQCQDFLLVRRECPMDPSTSDPVRLGCLNVTKNLIALMQIEIVAFLTPTRITKPKSTEANAKAHGLLLENNLNQTD